MSIIDTLYIVFPFFLFLFCLVWLCRCLRICATESASRLSLSKILSQLNQRCFQLQTLTSFSESCSIFHNLERTSASTTETVAAEQQHPGSASEIRRHRTLQQRISTSRPKYFSSTSSSAAPSIQWSDSVWSTKEMIIWKTYFAKTSLFKHR